jgi:polyisoprenoid-binding protein YceI
MSSPANHHRARRERRALPNPAGHARAALIGASMTIRVLLTPALALASLAPLGAQTAEFAIDPVHSTVMFTINHFGVSNFIGRFDEVSGELTWDEADPTKSKVTYSVAAASVDTNFKQRDQHVQSPSFLDAKQFPEITFVSSGFKKKGEQTYEVEGTVTLHGVSKPLTVELKKTGEGDDPQKHHRIGFWTTFTLKSSDFGITFMPPPMIGDEIEVTLSSEGVLK